MKSSKIVTPEAFSSFCLPLIGLQVSRVWQGYGSAIFLEFGHLHSTRMRSGQPGSPRGEWSLMIKWSWRIEGKRRIWCGSWSDGERWPRAFARLQLAKVASVALWGRLPELDIGLDNGLHVVSMMTSDGDPEWGLIKREERGSIAVGVTAGRLHYNEDLGDATS